MLINKWMDKYIMGHLHKGILLKKFKIGQQLDTWLKRIGDEGGLMSAAHHNYQSYWESKNIPP